MIIFTWDYDTQNKLVMIILFDNYRPSLPWPSKSIVSATCWTYIDRWSYSAFPSRRILLPRDCDSHNIHYFRSLTHSFSPPFLFVQLVMRVSEKTWYNTRTRKHAISWFTEHDYRCALCIFFTERQRSQCLLWRKYELVDLNDLTIIWSNVYSFWMYF